MAKLFRILNIITILLGTCSCISTPQDVVEQYDFQGPMDFADFYVECRSTNDVFDQAFIDSIVPRYHKLPFEDIVKVSEVIKDTPGYKPLTDCSLPASKIYAAFKEMDWDEGFDFYTVARCHFPETDKVYADSVLPYLLSAPYPVLKSLQVRFDEANIPLSIDSIARNSKSEFLNGIKTELEECRLASIEALDFITSTAIELSLDSLSNEDINTVMDKFSGGFLDYRKILVFFGRDMTDFEKIWNEQLNADLYREIFWTHGVSFLEDMYKLQEEYFFEIIGSPLEMKRLAYSPEIVTITFPKKDLEIFEKYLDSEKTGGAKSFVEWLPSLNPRDWIAELILAGVEITTDLIREEQSPEEAMEEYCQNFILSQITDSYKSNERSKIIDVINNSYVELYNNIENAL